jgi:hypothetical protein
MSVYEIVIDALKQLPMSEILRERLSLAAEEIARLEKQIAVLNQENRDLKAQLELAREQYNKAKEDYERLQKKHEERVFLFRGIEYRCGARTLGKWLPFCPKCNVVLHDEFGFDFKCLANCGWKSPLKWGEVREILKEMDGRESG